MSWLSDVRSLPLPVIAEKLGLSVLDGGRHLGPCPACSEATRSRTDTRPGPLYLTARGKGWICSRCGAKGGALELVSLRELGCRLAKGDERWEALRARCSELGLCGPAVVRLRRELPPPPPRKRIPVAELAELWARSTTATADPEVAAWLEGRGLDADRAARLDLVRALPAGGLPRWAHFRGAPWSHGWRALVRAHDHTGALASIRARWVRAEPPPSGGDKTGAAAGGPGSAGGAVLADAAGLGLLRGERLPGVDPDERIQVILTEGEPDWLTWALAPAERPRVVLGLYSGAWTAELAARVPSGSVVVVRTHHDEQGERYAEAAARSLYYRCDVRRSRRAA